MNHAHAVPVKSIKSAAAMNDRREKILKAIVEKFIETASPVGSKFIYEEYELDVSPATIRNEMARLESAGFISQPHTSAGRVPTNMAYRMFVDHLRFNLELFNSAKEDFDMLRKKYFADKAREKLYEVVSILAAATRNLSFATLPENKHLFYIGISHVLKQPEFINDPYQATKVIEVLENDFGNMLQDIDITDEPSFYIGEENLIPEIKSCSLLVQKYHYKGFNGVIGLLGATRMNYAYNIAAIRSAVELIS